MSEPGYPALLPLTDSAREAVGGAHPWPLVWGGERAVLGSEEGVGLTVRRPRVARRHCVVERVDGQAWLRHLGDAQPTRLNGERVQDAPLVHGDVLELPGPVAFRFLARPWVEAVNGDLEARARAAPEDEAGFAVWADWLLERGDALGERLLARPPLDAAESARWLGPLAGAWARGRLEVEWAHGLPVRAVVRQRERFLDALADGPAVTVGLLRTVRVFQWLRALEVDVDSFGSGPWAQEHLAQVLTELGRGGLPGLQSLRLGPLSSAAWTPRQVRLFDDARAALPTLRSTREQAAFDEGRAVLECLSEPRGVTVRPPPGHARQLSVHEPLLVGRTQDCAVRVEAPPGHPAEQVALKLEFDAHRWWVTDLAARELGRGAEQGPGVRVNGRPGVEVCLRGGDVLEPTPGLLLRFACPVPVR